MQNLYFCIPVHRFFQSAYLNGNPVPLHGFHGQKFFYDVFFLMIQKKVQVKMIPFTTDVDVSAHQIP